MAITTKYSIPLVSETKLNVPPQDCADGSGTGAAVTAGSNLWVLGSDMPKGRKLLVVVQTGALTNTPSKLTLSLYGGGANDSGGSAAQITSTITEWTTPAGNSTYLAEIDLSVVSDLTKYYSLALSADGSGDDGILAGASALVLDKTFL